MKPLAEIFLFILAVFILPTLARAYDFQACSGCHGAKLIGDDGRMFLHSPYADKKCGECHAAKTIVTAQQTQPSAQVLSVNAQNSRKINWLGDSVMADTKHGFLLPSDQVGENLVVDVQGANGKISRRKIAVPLLADLNDIEDPGRPPVVSGVQVLKVERGVFLSATIDWQTDTLADSLVYYGIQNLNQASESSKRLGKRHEVVLYNLKPDQVYRFSVVSTDPFGRSQASDPMEFSTSDPFQAPLPNTTASLVKSADEVKLADSFQRVGSNYLLQLTLGRPAAVYVGSRGVARQQAVPAESATALGTEEGVKDLAHMGLNSKEVASLDACKNCHQGENTATHPVNVYPKPGMIIPPEYPTLPDGRITCSTCHAPHSSNYEYLARKEGKRELCVGCHKDMI